MNHHQLIVEEVSFWVFKKKIAIQYDRLTHENNDSYFYLYKGDQRVSVIFEKDVDMDWLRFEDQDQNSILITSNQHAKTLFNKMVLELSK